MITGTSDEIIGDSCMISTASHHVFVNNIFHLDKDSDLFNVYLPFFDLI